MKFHFITVFILVCTSSPAWSERISDSMARPEMIHTPHSGTRDHEVMSAAEIQCVLEGYSDSARTIKKKRLSAGAKNISKDVAASTAENLNQALRMINFPLRKFTRVSLLHFLAQIIKESNAGQHNKELASRPAHRTGYGYIQVTGPGNLEYAAKCMNKIHPGLGNGVTSNPNHTIGAKAKNPVLPALASLCWWQQNMLRNPRRNELTRSDEEQAAVSISQIVNGGSIGAKMYKKGEDHARGAVFVKLLKEEKRCRNYSVPSA